MRGRRPLPVVVKESQGTLRAHREAAKPTVPKGTMSMIPTAPSGLSKKEKGRFVEIATELIRMKIMETTDLDLVLMLVMEESRYYECFAAMRKAKKYTFISAKGPKSSPENTVMTAAFKHITTLRSQLGLSPAARATLKISVSDDDNQGDDPLDAFDL